MNPFRIGVLASGGGSNLQALIDRQAVGDLPVEFAFVAGNNSKAGAAERTRAAGIPFHHISARTEGGEAEADAKLAALCTESGIALLVLAGYMKLIGPALLASMANRILNIHPAMLPAFGGAGFYGGRIHAAAIARGCQFTGVTLHMVNAEYDQGQILFQRVVRIRQDDTPESLGARVLEAEHDAYWRVVRAFALGQLRPLPAGSEPGQAVAFDAIFRQDMDAAYAGREIHG